MVKKKKEKKRKRGVAKDSMMFFSKEMVNASAGMIIKRERENGDERSCLTFSETIMDVEECA